MATTVELSPREEMILRGVADGKSYPAIACELSLSYETIKAYSKRIRAKIGVANKIGMAIWAERNLGVRDVDADRKRR